MFSTKNRVIGIIALSFSLVSIIGFSSCEKALDDITETATSAEDIGAATTAVISAFDVVDDVAASDGRSQKNGSTLIPDGVNIVFEDTTFTDGDGVFFFVDFGPIDPAADNKGVLCPDGKYRAGRIEVSIDRPYSQIGCVATINFSANSPYYVGDGKQMNKVQGVFSASRIAAEELRLEIANSATSTPEGEVGMSIVLTVKRTSGSGDIGTLGDEFELTGSGSGINRDGTNFSINITQPLFKRVAEGCAATFIKGIIELKNEGARSPMSINFDPKNDGACDTKAEVTLPGGVKREVDIK